MKKIVFILILGLVYCNSNNRTKIDNQKSEGITPVQEKTGYITLIFNNAPKAKFIPMGLDTILGGRSYFDNIASYRDPDGITYYIRPKRKPTSDTVFIALKKPKIEIYFEKLGLEGNSYLFNNGDKINVTYKNEIPEIEVLNRPTKIHDYDFDKIVSITDNNGTLTIFEKFFRHLTFPKSDKPLKVDGFKEFHENWLRENSPLLLENLKIQKKLLDSIYANGLMSKRIYHYYDEKLKYVNWNRLAKLKELPQMNEERPFLKPYNEGANSVILLEDDKEDSEADINTIFQSGDSLLGYKFYQDFLCDSYMPNYIENKTTKSTFSYGNFGGSYYNWADVYDTIQSSGLFPEKVKNFLEHRYMGKIVEDLSPNVAKKYYGKFKIDNTEQIYFQILNSKYGLDKSITDKLVLKNKHGDVSYLEDVLHKNLGNVLLLDFWASWCAPCIESIPHSNKLRTEMSGKDFVYISVATDEDFKTWKDSKSNSSITNLSHNYILQNPYSSKFLKTNHIIFVPRYLIMDKKGNIVHKNAPGPEEEELRVLLNKYLTE